MKLVLSRQAHGARNAVAHQLDDGTSLHWELLDEAQTGAMLAAEVELDPDVEWLMRLDRVDFPPGGVAYRHTHPGPGIRCLLFGSIRIESGGESHEYWPFEPWFESGPEPVFAQAAADRPSRFIRVMIIPRAFMGKSTLRLVNKEDEGKPRAQQYKVYFDALLDLSAAKP